MTFLATLLAITGVGAIRYHVAFFVTIETRGPGTIAFGVSQFPTFRAFCRWTVPQLVPFLSTYWAIARVWATRCHVPFPATIETDRHGTMSFRVSQLATSVAFYSWTMYH